MYMITSVTVILILLIGSIQCPGAGGGRGEEYRRKELENHDQAQDSRNTGQNYRGKGQDGRHNPNDYADRTRNDRINNSGIKVVKTNDMLRGSNSTRKPTSSETSTSSGTSSFVGGLVTIVAISVLACIVCCAVCCSKRNTSSKENNNNKEPVNPTASPKLLSEQNPFQTGIYAFRYHQYDKWHGPYRLLLTFDQQLWKVNGKGADDVGSFICDGVYSPEHRRLDLTLRYDEDTGNPEENFGQTSTLQLHWNSTRNAFEGTWYVRTPTYTGEGKFEMEFKEHAEPLLKPDHAKLV